MSATFWKSSMVMSTSAERAIARMWSTALVEPPMTLTTVIAFKNELRVRMSLYDG